MTKKIAIIITLLLLGFLLRNYFFNVNIYETYYLISYSYIFILVALLFMLNIVFKLLKKYIL